MAELVDALVSGTSGSNTLEVRVFLCPPYFAKATYGRPNSPRLRMAGQIRQGGCGRLFFGVVAQLIERYVRIVEVVGLSPISSTKIFEKVFGDMAEW